MTPEELEKLLAGQTTEAAPAATQPAAPAPIKVVPVAKLAPVGAAPRTKPVTVKTEGVKVPKPKKVEAPAAPVAETPVVTPDVSVDLTTDLKKFQRLSQGVDSHVAAAQILGPDFERQAQAQGVDLKSVFDATKKGRSFDEIAKANRERGVIGFVPPAEREAAWKDTVQRFEKAQQGDAGDDLKLKISGADKGVGGSVVGGAALGAATGAQAGPIGAAVGAVAGGVIGASPGYVAQGTKEALPEVTKPGEYGYQIAETLVRALAKDKEASALYDRYGRQQQGGATIQYVQKRVEDLAKRSGLSASDPQFDDKLKALRRRATKEVIAYKTIGLWTPVVLAKDVAVVEGIEDPGFLEALAPNIELVGFDNKNQAIFRQESALGTLFRLIDVPQEAFIGARQAMPEEFKVEKMTPGELAASELTLGLSTLPRLARGISKIEPGKVAGGAARGIMSGANVMEEAQAIAEEENAPGPVRVAAALAGLGATVAFPDMLGLVHAGPGAAKAILGARDAKRSKEAYDLVQQVQLAYAQNKLREAAQAEAKLRDRYVKVADILDRYDAAAAERFDVINPELGHLDRTLPERVDKVLGKSESGAGNPILHPSLRAKVQADTQKNIKTSLSYPEQFDYTRHLQGAQKDAAAIRSVQTANPDPRILTHFEEQVDRVVDEVFGPDLNQGNITQAEYDTIRQAVKQGLPALYANPKNWSGTLRAMFQNNPAMGALSRNLRQGVYARVAPKMVTDFERTMKLADTLESAAQTAIDTRGTAAGYLMTELAQDFPKVRVTPPDLYADVALKTVTNEPVNLSEIGKAYLLTLRCAQPRADFNELYAQAAIMDRSIQSWAETTTAKDPYLYFEKFGPEIQRGGNPPPAPKAPPTATTPPTAPPPAPPAAPTAPPAAPPTTPTTPVAPVAPPVAPVAPPAPIAPKPQAPPVPVVPPAAVTPPEPTPIPVPPPAAVTPPVPALAPYPVPKAGPPPKAYSSLPNKGNEYETPWTAYLTGKDSAEIRAKAAERGDIGLLVTPYSAGLLKHAGAYPVFAVDNGVFAKEGFNEAKFNGLIDKLATAPQPIKDKLLYVVAPDVLLKTPEGDIIGGDAKATLEKFKTWGPKIRAKGLPVALVAQNGLEDMIDEVPWGQFDVLFIGGNDEWKVGDLVGEQKAKWDRLFQAFRDHGVPIHMGRVSGPERISQAAHDVGAATVDGTMLRFDKPAQSLAKLENMLDRLNLEQANVADYLYPDTGVLPDAGDLLAAARDPRVTSYDTLVQAYPGLNVQEPEGLVLQARAERRRVWNGIRRLREEAGDPSLPPLTALKPRVSFAPADVPPQAQVSVALRRERLTGPPTPPEVTEKWRAAAEVEFASKSSEFARKLRGMPEALRRFRGHEQLLLALSQGRVSPRELHALRKLDDDGLLRLINAMNAPGTTVEKALAQVVGTAAPAAPKPLIDLSGVPDIRFLRKDYKVVLTRDGKVVIGRPAAGQLVDARVYDTSLGEDAIIERWLRDNEAAGFAPDLNSKYPIQLGDNPTLLNLDRVEPIWQRMKAQPAAAPAAKATGLSEAAKAQIAKLEDEIDAAIENDDMMRVGELEAEIENIRQGAPVEAPAPKPVPAAVEAPKPAAPAVVEAPVAKPVEVRRPLGPVEAQLRSYGSFDKVMEAVPTEIFNPNENRRPLAQIYSQVIRTRTGTADAPVEGFSHATTLNATPDAGATWFSRHRGDEYDLTSVVYATVEEARVAGLRTMREFATQALTDPAAQAVYDWNGLIKRVDAELEKLPNYQFDETGLPLRQSETIKVVDLRRGGPYTPTPEELAPGGRPSAPPPKSVEERTQDTARELLASGKSQKAVAEATGLKQSELKKLAAQVRTEGRKAAAPEAAPTAEAGVEGQLTLEEAKKEGKAPIEVSEEGLKDTLGKFLFGQEDPWNNPFVPAEKTKVIPRNTPEIPQAEANAKIESWKAEAQRQGKEGKNRGKVVLSLFDASGEWSKPWREAGYDVFQFDLQHGDDIRKFSADFLAEEYNDFNGEVFAILAAPPCTNFSGAGARWWSRMDAAGETKVGMELVDQTLSVVERYKPAVWVLENPAGRIKSLTGLPEPTLSFNPHNFGNPYTKRTLLWGDFNPELPLANVFPSEGSRMWAKLGGKDKFQRSLTPEGFAYAFFMANNAEALGPAKTIAREMRGVPEDLVQKALDAGHEAEDIKYAVEDVFYQEQSPEEVTAILEEMIANPVAKAPPAVEAPKAVEAVEEAPKTYYTKYDAPTLEQVQTTLADARAEARRVGGERPADLVEWDPDSNESIADWALRSIAYDLAQIDAKGLKVPPDIMDDTHRALADAQEAKAEVYRLSEEIDQTEMTYGERAAATSKSSALDQAISRELRVRSQVNDIRNGAAGGAAAEPRFTVVNSRAVPGVRTASLRADDKYIVVDNWKGRAAEDIPVGGKPKYYGFRTKAEGEAFIKAQVAEEAARRAAAPTAVEPAAVEEAPSEYRSLTARDLGDQAQRERIADVLIRRTWGEDIAAEWEDIPEQLKVDAGRRLRAAAKRLELPEGAKLKITQDEYNTLVAGITRDLENKAVLEKAKRLHTPPVRGAARVRSHLLDAVSKGRLDQRVVDMADWFLQQNPRVADDLSLVYKGPTKQETMGRALSGVAQQGEYHPLSRIVELFTDAADEETAVHEILHHTERMMPEEVQMAIRKEWAKQLAARLKTATPAQRPALEAMLTQKNLGLVDTAFKDKVLPLGEFYQFVNPSEFWAVNASRIVTGRYAAFNAGLVAKAKRWLTEFVQKAKSVFGLQSDAAVIRGLDGVLKGDGTFVSKLMLREGKGRLWSLTEAPTPAAAEIEAAAPGISDLRRAMLEAAGDETAFDPKVYAERKEVCKLTGHCNAAAYIVQKEYGGELLSAKVQGETHVWNRLPDGTQVDLTGSQYGGDGFHPVAPSGKVVPPRATVNPRFKKFEAEVVKAKQAPTPSGITEAAEAPATLEQVSPTTGQVKGAVGINPDTGRFLITLFKNADPSTALHELAHILRRTHLDSEDMQTFVDYAKAEGLNVDHQFGEFTGAPDEVIKAEELFAQAFERYVIDGVAPDPAVQAAFDKLQSPVANVYQGIQTTPFGRSLDPKMTQLFDQVVKTTKVAPPQPLLPEVIYHQAEAVRRPMTEGPLTAISREANRLGIKVGTSPEELATKLRASLAANNNDPKLAKIVFPAGAKVFGKTEWTAAELSELGSQLAQQASEAVGRAEGIGIDLSRRGGGSVIREKTPVERIRSALSKQAEDRSATAAAKATGRVFVGTFFGGDVVGQSLQAGDRGMRDVPVELRRDFDAATRNIEQGIGDTVTVLNDVAVHGNERELYEFLGGKTAVKLSNGRAVFSSGYDMAGATNRMIARVYQTLSPEKQEGLLLLADAVNTTRPGKSLSEVGYHITQQDIDDALTAIQMDLASKEAARLGRALSAGEIAALRPANLTQAQTGALRQQKWAEATKKMQAGADSFLKWTPPENGELPFMAAIRSALGFGDVVRPDQEYKAIESMLYVSGITPRNGAMFSGKSDEAAQILLRDLRTIYTSPSDAHSGEQVARQVAVLIGAYGQADRSKNLLVGLGLAIDKESRDAFVAFMNKWQVPAGDRPKVERLLARFGQNTKLVTDTALGADYYIPQVARDRIAQSLGKAVFIGQADVDVMSMTYRYMKTRMTRGSIVLRQRYFTANTVDHFLQMAVTVGYAPALQSVSRVLAQDIMVLPIWSQAVEIIRRSPVGKRIPPDALEKIRAGLSKLGDRAAWALGAMFGSAKYRIEVNPILEGIDGTIVVGDRVYSIKDIRNIAVEEGIFASLDTRELQNAILREGQIIADSTGVRVVGASKSGIISSTLEPLMEDVRNLSEAWAERERLGAMVTLMEQGFDPRVAARLTIDALYDYSQTMTKADRSWLVGVVFPFWAFQKNANQAVFNLALSPQGAYRMMCIQRARTHGAELLTELLYNEVGDDYGVDVKSMPPELQESYYAIITKVEQTYPNGVPLDVKMAMRLLLSGRPGDIYGGTETGLSAAIRTMRESGAFGDLSVFEPFAVPRPEKSARSSYMRDRPGIAVTPERNELSRFYYSLVGSNDHSYVELMLPESFIESGMRHLSYVSAAYIMLAAKAGNKVGLVPSDTGIEEVNWFTAIAPILDVERSPILGPILNEYTSGGVGYPKRVAPILAETATKGGKVLADGLTMVHPTLGKMMDDMFGTTFVRVPEVGDPIAMAVANGTDIREIADERLAEIRQLQEKYPDSAVLRKQRYYLPGGLWSTMFENTPLGELNRWMLSMPATEMEKLSTSTYMMSWARTVLGLDVVEVSGSRTARQEEPQKLKPTKEM